MTFLSECTGYIQYVCVCFDSELPILKDVNQITVDVPLRNCELVAL